MNLAYDVLFNVSVSHSIFRDRYVYAHYAPGAR